MKTAEEKQAQVDEIVGSCHDLVQVNKNGSPTGAWAYLVSRGIDPTKLPPDVKMHRKMGKGSIAVLCRDESGKVTGVHEIFVEPNGQPRTIKLKDGTERRKLSFGTIQGNAFRFPSDGEPPEKYHMDVDRTPIICEGFETAASIWQSLDRKRDVYCSFGAGLIGDVQVPKAKNKRTVLVVADADDPESDGYKDTLRSIHRLIKRGYHVRHTKPAGGGGRDANDVLRENGDEAVRDLIRSGRSVPPGQIAEAVKAIGHDIYGSADAGEKHFLDGIEGDTDPAPAPAEPLRFVDILDCKESEIPLRDMLVEDMIERAKLSILAGQGGSLKSTTAIYLALTCAIGSPVGPFRPTRAYRVGYCGVEDDVTEQRRRMFALLKTREFEGLRIAEQDGLFMKGGSLHTLDCCALSLFRRNPESGDIEAGEHFGRLIDAIKALKLDLVIIDPLIEIIEGANENDNAHMHKVMGMLREVAREFNVHVMVVHHFNKVGDASSQGAVRGGSSIVNAARFVINLEKPSRDDCRKRGIAEADQHLWVRMFVPKANNTATGVEHWFKICVKTLKNGERVAAIENRHPEGDASPITTEIVTQFLDVIEKRRPPAKKRTEGDRYTDSDDGPKHARAETILMNLGVSEKRARALISSFKEIGILGSPTYNRPSDRQEVSNGLVVLRRPGPSDEVF